MVLSQGAPLRSREDLRLPALSFWPGHMPAHASRCPAVGKRLMSRPISARMVVAPRMLMPGTEHRSRISDRLIDPGDRLAQRVVLAQVKFEHEAMMVRQPSMQRIIQDLG